MVSSDIYGCVLSGGKSERMGKDKGLLSYHGKPQREYLFAILQRRCARVFTSAYVGQEIPPHLHPMVDVFNFRSPINGILTAFKKFPDKAWLIVAVDMPYVDEAVIDLLIANRDIRKTATCFYNADQKLPEPLLTLWEPAAFPLLLKFVENGKISPRDFLNTQPIRMIDPPDQKTLLNYNSPGEIPPQPIS